jgi:uncharacterized protein (DUF1697 family)
MTTHIALLRAVNLGSYNAVAMPDLRGLLVGLGFTDPRTLLQSGNAVFGGGKQTPASVERKLEKEAAARLGLQTGFFVRTAVEWHDLVAANPFSAEAERDPGHLLVMCLKAAPAPEAVAALQASIVGRERVRVAGRQAYIVYPDGVGRSRLSNALIEKRLATRGTARNWNTVLKLAALVGG